MKTNNVFSDEKLEQVEISIESHEAANIRYITLGIDELTDLLARLDAAEWCITNAYNNRLGTADVEAWRKVSGKEPKA